MVNPGIAVAGFDAFLKSFAIAAIGVERTRARAFTALGVLASHRACLRNRPLGASTRTFDARLNILAIALRIAECAGILTCRACAIE